MAENDRVTEVTDEVRLPDNTVVKEYTNPETGNVTYRRTGEGISGAQFISPDVAEGLQTTTELGGAIEVPEGEITQQELDQYGVGIDGEELRKRRIENKYEKWDQYSGIRTDQIPGGESKRRERWIQGWIENNELQTQVENDPLLENDQEKKRAQEAMARRIVDELEEVNSRQEAMRVLRNYGIY